MANALGGVPRLIREIFYAPACPPNVAMLLDVALTQHNKGCYEAAINTYTTAQSAWEEELLKENFADLEDKDSTSILARLVEQENKKKDAEREAFRKAQEEAEAALAEAAAEIEAEQNGVGVQPPPPPKDKKESEAEAALREAEERAVEEARQKEEAAAAQRQKRVAALHQCQNMIPTEGKIHMRLGIASVLESAGDDEKALGELLYALKLCQTLPVYNTQLVTATVYGCLGGLYYHLSQYDFAADYYFRSLEIREAMLTGGHVDVGMIMNNIGCVLHLLDRPNDAVVMLYRAQEIFEAQLPPTHPRLELCTGNIRRTKGVMLKNSVAPPVPFTPSTIPMCPGAKRAKAFYAPKPKKPKAKADDKKKK